jgi:hypothetical protein
MGIRISCSLLPPKAWKAPVLQPPLIPADTQSTGTTKSLLTWYPEFCRITGVEKPPAASMKILSERNSLLVRALPYPLSQIVFNDDTLRSAAQNQLVRGLRRL